VAEGADKGVLSVLATAFAFTYCLSTILFVVLTKVPDMLGRDLAKSAKQLETAIAGDSDAPLPGAGDEFFGRPLPVALRTYEIEKPEIVGHPLGELRTRYPRVSIERVVRDGDVIVPRDDLELRLHDTVAIYGEVPVLVVAGPRIGPEVYERVARDVGAATVDVVVLHGPVGHKLSELASDVGHGLYMNAMFRGGEQIPAGPETTLVKGDVLRVTGSAWRIKKLEDAAGKVVRPSISTDIVTLALGVALGALVGAITIPFGRIHLQLGAAVGLLLLGIALSVMRTRKPTLGGPFPEPARQLFEDLGLNVYVAVLGLNAGAGVIEAMAQGEMLWVILASVVVGFVPPILAWIIGRRLFHMNEALLLGAVAGGRCNSAGLRSAQEVTHSSVPAISYPATFALSNIAFTLFAYVITLLD
jgi:putative transport protein